MKKKSFDFLEKLKQSFYRAYDLKINHDLKYFDSITNYWA